MENELKKPSNSKTIPGMSLVFIAISLIGIVAGFINGDNGEVDKQLINFILPIGFLLSSILILSIFSLKSLRWFKLLNAVIIILWVISFVFVNVYSIVS